MLLFIWQKIGAIIFSVAGTPLSLGCYDRLSHNLEGFAEDQHPNQVRCNTCDLQLLQSNCQIILTLFFIHKWIHVMQWFGHHFPAGQFL